MSPDEATPLTPRRLHDQDWSIGCQGGTPVRVGRWFKVQQLDAILQLGLTAYSVSLEAAVGPSNANQGAIGVDMGVK